MQYKLQEEALDGTLWRTPFGRGSGPVESRHRDNDGHYDDHMKTQYYVYAPIISP